MAYTSGTSSFNLDLNTLIEEAFERCGKELRTGYDLRTARRSINIMTIEWANRGINLWTIEQGQIPLVTGQGVYALPTDTIDLLDTVIRQNNGTTNQIDINISRISESTYSTLPNKLTQGRPIQVWVNRQSGNTNVTTAYLSTTITSTDTTITVSDASQLASTGFIQLDSEIIYYANVNGNQLINCARGQNGTTAAAHTATTSPRNYVYVPWLPSINIWPTPNAPGNQYMFVYWRMRRVQDAGNGINVQDIPFRFIPCLVAGLAYHLSVKLEGVDPQRVMGLKAEYEQQFDFAAQEDREKASIRFVPRNMNYYR
jgi:hypothetical protein